jgi:hypothetical protein
MSGLVFGVRSNPVRGPKLQETGERDMLVEDVSFFCGTRVVNLLRQGIMAVLLPRHILFFRGGCW